MTEKPRTVTIWAKTDNAIFWPYLRPGYLVFAVEPKNEQTFKVNLIKVERI